MDAAQTEMLAILMRDGLVSGPRAELCPLSGGVSSEIYLVNDNGSQFVVKRALAKLKVKDDWYADVSRNKSEYDYINYVSRFAPENVPRIVGKGNGYFAMEYLGSEYKNWKTLLMNGDCRIEHARMAGDFLAKSHHQTMGVQEAANRFDYGQNFFDLRIEPYIVTTGKRNPELGPLFHTEAGRLKNTRHCLAHGDYSPKNILIKGDRLVVLDCEVANYGDPVFDYCFMMTHLCLKALVHAPTDVGIRNMVGVFRDSYLEQVGYSPAREDAFAGNAARLLPMMLLARIDGKSPVEYIQNEAPRELIRLFVYEQLHQKPNSDVEVVDNWFERLKEAQR